EDRFTPSAARSAPLLSPCPAAADPYGSAAARFRPAGDPCTRSGDPCTPCADPCTALLAKPRQTDPCTLSAHDYAPSSTTGSPGASTPWPSPPHPSDGWSISPSCAPPPS